MQVDLPIHQPPCNKEFLDRINPLLLDDEFIINNVKHIDNAIETNHTLGHTGKKAIPIQIIHPVDVELTGYQLEKKLPCVAVIEHLNSQIESTRRRRIQFIHHER